MATELSEQIEPFVILPRVNHKLISPGLRLDIRCMTNFVSRIRLFAKRQSHGTPDYSVILCIHLGVGHVLGPAASHLIATYICGQRCFTRIHHSSFLPGTYPRRAHGYRLEGVSNFASLGQCTRRSKRSAQPVIASRDW